MAEDMILEVKETVAKTIALKVNKQMLPPAIDELLRGPWGEVMKIIGIRDGCAGDAWDKALSLVDDLIFSVQPKLVVRKRQQFLDLIPKILQTLQEGLVMLCYEQQEINRFFSVLEKIHLNAFCMDSASDTDKVNTATQTSGVALLERQHEELFKDIGSQSSKHHVFQCDVSDPKLRQSKFFDTVRTMPLGTWVEFKDSSGVKRGKLAWRCDFTGDFTFIDRMYKVIADVPMRDLITCFEHGSARLVNGVPLFGRAMDAVVSGMRNYGGRAYNNQTALN